MNHGGQSSRGMGESATVGTSSTTISSEAFDGVDLQITTTVSQTADAVASALAAAINTSSALPAQFDVAAAQGNQVATTGLVEERSIDDAGLVPTMPAVRLVGRLALGLGLSLALPSGALGVRASSPRP